MAEDPPGQAPSLAYKIELCRAVAGLRLPLYEMKVAVLLSTLLGKGGFAFPPHALLAEMGGMHKRHVARAVKGLLARGIIAIADPGTPSRAARYTLDADAILALLGTSMGGAEAPPQVARPRLYGRLGGTSTGGAAPPPGAPEGQRRVVSPDVV